MFMKRLVTAAVLFLTVVGARGGEYWQQEVKYVIEVELNVAERTIGGKLKLDYTNNSSDTLNILYFRAAANVMRPGSPLHMREISRGRDRFKGADTTDFGCCEIHSLEDETGGRVDFTVDYSIVRVKLENPVLPGETRGLRLEFTTRLPSPALAYRFAFIRGQFKAAHWYPQACVYDRILGWVNNQYLGWGENYGDIGIYDVSITAPSEYIVAATGVLVNRNEALPDTLGNILRRENFVAGAEKPDLDFMQSGGKTWRFMAENVCDFAFAADDEFCLDEAEYDGIKIYAYIRREHADDWHDAAETGRRGIQYFSENFGRYAYPQMSITDSWGGMEFPMLIMCGGYSPRYYLLFWHEIGHNYFMGAVSTNQTDRAFLDEGFTTFLEIAAMEHFLGREDNLRRRTDWYSRKFFPHEEDRVHRGFRPYMDPALHGYTQPMPMNADSAPEWLIYRASSYYKPVCMLFALEYMLGREELFRCIREYYERWKFRHPYERDMFDSFEQSTGQELTYFFEQWVYTDKKLDYALSKPLLVSASEGEYHYRLRVKRTGDLMMPVGVEAVLKDGSRRRFWIPLNDNPAPPSCQETLPVWDQLRNPRRIYNAEIVLPSQIKSLDIDPEGLLADLNPLNNRWPLPKVQLNWLAEQNFLPVNAYQIRHRPSFGYNSVDGMKLGWRFNGSYMDYRHRFDFSGKIGALNFEPDWSLAYSTPLDRVSPQASLAVSGFDRNGCQGGDWGFCWRDKPRYSGGPIGGFKVAVQHRRHYSDDYPLFSSVWDKGADNALSLWYWRNLTPGGTARMEIKALTSAFSDDFSYSRLEGRLSQMYSLGWGFDFNLDLGAGMVKGDKIPAQRLFYASGWEPEIDRGYEYFGVKGLVPPGEKTHFMTRSSPGVYGLSDRRIGEDSFTAISAELTTPPEVEYEFWLPFYGDIRPSFQPVLFYNVAFVGESLSSSGDYIWEIGPGVKLTGIPGGTFRLAFPLWLDPAQEGEDHYDFRWVFTFVPEFKK